jgi:hypothetical protein
MNDLHIYSINLGCATRNKLNEMMTTITMHQLRRRGDADSKSSPNPDTNNQTTTQSNHSHHTHQPLNDNYISILPTHDNNNNTIPYPSHTIICMQETWWDQKIPSLSPFALSYTNRKERKGGGTAIAISKDLQFINRSDLNVEKYIQATCIELPQYRTILACIYNPRNPTLVTHYLKLLAGTAKAERKELIVTGDFNAHHTRWHCKATNKDGKIIEGALDRLRLHVYNDMEPTRLGNALFLGPGRDNNASVLDLMLGTIANLKARIVAHDISDHALQYMHCIAECRREPTEDTFNPRKNLSALEWKEFAQKVDELISSADIMDPSISVDEAAIIITQIIVNTFRSLVRNRKNKKEHKHNHWYNKEIGQLILEKHKAWVQMKRCKSNSQRFENQRGRYRNKCKEIKKAVRRAKKAGWDRFNAVIAKTEDPKKIWAMFNRAKGTTAAQALPINLPNSNNSIVERLDHLNYYFCIMGTPPAASSQPVKAPPKFPNLEKRDITSVDEVTAIVMKLNPDKATGPDNVSNRMLQHLPKTAMEAITGLFNRSWSQGIFPELWKQAHIHPIPKKPPIVAAKDFRPISLLSALGKVMEKVVAGQIYEECQRKHILDDHQYGFRRNTSTTHALVNLTNNIYNHIHSSKRNGTMAVLIDLKAAYDSVNHDQLLYKIHKLPLPPHFYNWLVSYLEDRSSRTRAITSEGKHLSNPLIFSRGTPQGSALSPLIFSLFINAISQLVQQYNADNRHFQPEKQHTILNLQLFADDMILWVNEKNADDARIELQLGLNIISQEFGALELNPNPSKCQMISFWTKRRDIATMEEWDKAPLHINGISIPYDPQPKYLGVYLDKHLEWANHVQQVSDKFEQRLNMLKRHASAHRGITASKCRILYHGFVKPVLEYASPAWLLQLQRNHAKSYNFRRLMTLDHDAKRWILGAIDQTSTEALHVESAIASLPNRVLIATAKLTIKSYQHHAAHWDHLVSHSLPNSPISNIIKTTAQIIAFDNRNIIQFINHCRNNQRYIPSLNVTIKKRVAERWQLEWSEAPKGRAFHILAPSVSFKVQPHHKLGLPRRHEVTLTRLRLNHAYTNEYKNKRFGEDPSCRICGDTTESVNHMLLECPNSTQVEDMRRHAARITKQEIETITLTNVIGTATFSQLKHHRHKSKFVGALTRLLEYVATHFTP